MRIRIKQIIRWEQLRDKPFYTLDPADNTDVVALMYVTADDSVVDNSTFEIFEEVTKTRADELAKMSRDITRYLNYVHQFSAVAVEEEKEVDPMALHKEEKTEEQIRVSEIVTGLIFEGVDANYLLNDVEICDLPMLCKGAEMKMRRQKEDSRLWTFILSRPYMDSSCKSTTDFYPFPWEDEGKPAVVSDDDMAMAEAILNVEKEENNG